VRISTCIVQTGCRGPLQTLLPVEEFRKRDGTTGKQSTGLSGAAPAKADLANIFSRGINELGSMPLTRLASTAQT
jgi:hypothetical protein